MKKKSKNKNKTDYKWIVTVFLLSLTITMVLSLLSGESMSRVNIAVSIGILMLFIFIGVVFDMIGLAAATCEEKAFHSMASHKIGHAKHAINLIRNAERVASFCNDVIGDIAGIVSGATGAAVAVKFSAGSIYAGLFVTSLIAALTVGLKALGKGFAISYNREIINGIATIIYFFKR